MKTTRVRMPAADPPAEPARVVQRVNVDFPLPLLEEIDQEVARLGVTRQAWIKLRCADALREARQAVVATDGARRRARR